MSDQLKSIFSQLAEIATALRSIRIQVILLALKDTKEKHPRVVILENMLNMYLRQVSRNNHEIDEILEELDTIIMVKPEHHQQAQETVR